MPNIRAENGPADAHVRIGWFRAVSNNFHAFAAHSFADEMAKAAGRDSLEYLLDLLGPGKVIDLKSQGVDYSNYGAPYDKYPIDTRRLRKVLEVAGEKAGWGKRKPGNGWGMGIAAHRSFNTYVASVVEVEVDAKGAVKVPRIEQVVDAGVIVNPESRPVADGRCRRHGGRPGASGRDHGGRRPHQAEQLQRFPGCSHGGCAVPGERPFRGQ